MAVQLKHGFDFSDFIGTYKSPDATAITSGMFVELGNGVIAIADGEAVDDGKYIILQEVTVDGPTYQEIVNRVVQHEVKAGEPVTIVPRKRSAIIRTNVIATGLDVGAIAAATAVGTELGMINGVLREAQGGDIKVGVIRVGLGSDGFIEVELY